MRSTEVRADFPADPASAGAARRFVNDTLRTWHVDDLTDVAVLLVSELVSNAILHAGTTIAVVVTRVGARLRVEVRDGSARSATRKHYSALSTTGRGLLLVEEMADEWGVATTRDGKAVWFELALPEPLVGDAKVAARRRDPAPGPQGGRAPSRRPEPTSRRADRGTQGMACAARASRGPRVLVGAGA